MASITLNNRLLSRNGANLFAVAALFSACSGSVEKKCHDELHDYANGFFSIEMYVLVPRQDRGISPAVVSQKCDTSIEGFIFSEDTKNKMMSDVKGLRPRDVYGAFSKVKFNLYIYKVFDGEREKYFVINSKIE